MKHATLSLFLFFPLLTQAQSQGQWGMGMYGGMQGCGTQMQVGQGALSMTDDIKDAQDRYQKAQRELQAKKSEKKKLDRDLERSKQDVQAVIADDYSDFIFEHIENSRDCKEYKGLLTAQAPSATLDEGAADLPAPQAPAPQAALDTRPFQAAEWSQLCDPNKNGSVFPAACDGARFQQQDGDSRGDRKSCKKGLSDYRKNYAKSQKLQREIDSLEKAVSQAKDDMKDAKQAMIDDVRNSNTEGGICVECMANNNNYNAQPQQNQTNWANVAANVGTGLLAVYAGYQTNKMVAQYNSNLGYPTQTYPAWGYGLPYFANGIYGALSGSTGQGAFGCGASGGGVNSGAFGYPNGMFGNMLGGGMYAGGYGMMMNGGYPMASGLMMGGGYPMSGMMMGGGYPMSGMMMSGYGNMMGMMMSNGLMMSGGLMSTGMMMSGMMSTGMMSSGMMSSGMMSSGMMSSGMMMYGGLMSSGLMSSGLMSTGLMMSGMMMDSSSLMLQQMQMQAYQSYLQQQAAKYQTLSGYQQQLYSLLYRSQGILSGTYGTTSYLGNNYSTYGGIISGGSITSGSALTSGTISGR